MSWSHIDAVAQTLSYQMQTRTVRVTGEWNHYRLANGYWAVHDATERTSNRIIQSTLNNIAQQQSTGKAILICSTRIDSRTRAKRQSMLWQPFTVQHFLSTSLSIKCDGSWTAIDLGFALTWDCPWHGFVTAKRTTGPSKIMTSSGDSSRTFSYGLASLIIRRIVFVASMSH